MTPRTKSTPVFKKMCTKCKKNKRLSEFYPLKFGKYGRVSMCNICNREYQKLQRSKRNSYEHRRKARIYYLSRKNKYPTYKDIVKAKGPKWAKENIIKLGFIKFRVDGAWFDKKLREQRGKCAICGIPKEHQKWRRFCIDHDHDCCNDGRACDMCRRGLLCHKCNIKLGMIEDAKWIAKSLAYLIKYGKDLSPIYAILGPGCPG